VTIDVTVLTPSFGYGDFIADAIESVIRQDGIVVQHIVQDAGSQDETLRVLRSYEHHVQWISEEDTGQSDALNRALSKAEGRWIAWLNADEFYLPGGLRRLVEEGDARGADVMYGDCVAVDDRGRLLDLRPQHPFSKRILRLYGPFVDTVSMIARRVALPERPWDESLRIVMDWDFYLNLTSSRAVFEYVPYPVGAYRRHPNQASRQPGRFEDIIVRERHGIPSANWTRRAGVVLHRMRKLTAGSYVRQLRARSLYGRDLRWFGREEELATSRALLDRCYGLNAEAKTP
jgi:glycosyltransferase involved in cell wall biosynthesis